jgi:hypothetical protein
MDKHDKMTSPEEPGRSESDPYGRIAELARDVLRSRGLTEKQIDALLKRPRVPDSLRGDDNLR